MIRASSLDSPYRTHFTNGSFDAIADVPVEKGGAGLGFGPHELLEAAFATCLTMTAQMYAVKHHIPLKAVQAEVTIDRSQPSAAVLKYALTFAGDLTTEQIVQLHDAVSRCPVAKTLTGSLTLHQVES